MKILVINCGSSSIKYKLYDFPKNTVIAKGLIDRIGEGNSAVSDHAQGVQILLDRLVNDKVISSLKEITAVGHRVVHGAETFRKPHIIDEAVIKKIKDCSELAPLHNPANLSGIMGCKKALPNVSQVAVFDTAFHQSIPDYAYLYPIPMKFYTELSVRKYGFHGTSHEFVAKKAAAILKKPFNKLKLITCHLGNGCSITAVNKGKSIDTSMGFTPLEGLMMGTRSGDIDVAAVFYIMEKEKLNIQQMDRILNRQSGILGISGLSNDIRLINRKIKANDPKAKLAMDMFCYRIKKYIGSYMMVLGGADAVCFTAGIGENNPQLIKQFKKDILKISPKTKVLVVPTDEELMIADLTYGLIKNVKLKE
jgi:acetate kinase